MEEGTHFLQQNIQKLHGVGRYSYGQYLAWKCTSRSCVPSASGDVQPLISPTSPLS